jgi:hypothetical protein
MGMEICNANLKWNYGMEMAKYGRNRKNMEKI